MQFFYATLADAFGVEGVDVVGGSAEGAGGGELSQLDGVVYYRDDELVAFADVEESSGFDGDDDPSEVVELADDTGVHCYLFRGCALATAYGAHPERCIFSREGRVNPEVL